MKRMHLFHRTKTPTRIGPARAPGSSGASIEDQTQQIGRDLLQCARAHTSGFFSSRFWSDKLMEWATKDPAFKVQLFRLVDVFPMLNSPERVHEHLVDYFSQPGVTLPMGMSLGLKAG